MYRCFELAVKGLGTAAPNPIVGAVLVYQQSIIGEGFHEFYGGPHAEVNCIQSVAEKHKNLIEKCTLYISLEPCAHFGKTPPCTNLIIDHKIKKVVIGCRDPFEAVNGKGVEILKQHGVDITEGILESEASTLNKRFFCFHKNKRPFILIKWAETSNGYIAPQHQTYKADRWLISTALTKRFVHRLRKEQMAILIGTNTACWDDPVLNSHLQHDGKTVRLIIDKSLRIPTSHKIYNTAHKTYVFNYLENKNYSEFVEYICLSASENLLQSLMNWCYKNGIQSLLVEGGRKTIESFFEAGLYDEVVQIINNKSIKEIGLESPDLPNDINLDKTFQLEDDTIKIYTKSITH